MTQNGTRSLTPIKHRGPLRVMFMLTSMPVGGAETLLVNLVRGMDRESFHPMICCLKEPGPLGLELADEMPVFSDLIKGKYDVAVTGRIKRLMQKHQIDALITVGAGDKMFWGRIAAKRARVPVIASALHSTGWPDGVGRLNRMLTPITDAFIAVADEHGRYLVEQEKFPADKVVVIGNGIDTGRFQFDPAARRSIRSELGIEENAPVCGIVAALRPEKNHELFLQVAHRVAGSLPEVRFVIVGDGPELPSLEQTSARLGLDDAVIFTGSRNDIPQLLSALDLFTLTSDNEASPVSILEAMSVGLPVVAPRVGSIADTLHDGDSGFLVDAGNSDQYTQRWTHLLTDLDLASRTGKAGQKFVRQYRSLDSMINGYQQLISRIYSTKTAESDSNHALPAGKMAIDPTTESSRGVC